MSTVETKEGPILFNGEMVKAILDGRKTNTRRVMTPQPQHAQVYTWKGKNLHDSEYRHWCWKGHVGTDNWDDITNQLGAFCPYGVSGDHLWVRETFRQLSGFWHGDTRDEGRPIEYRTNPTRSDIAWRHSIHMPRWASRITLEVTGVRVERLQDITEEDAVKEGFVFHYPTGNPDVIRFAAGCTPTLQDASSAVGAFQKTWRELNDSRGYSWESNPYVWVVDFKRVEKD